MGVVFGNEGVIASLMTNRLQVQTVGSVLGPCMTTKQVV